MGCDARIAADETTEIYLTCYTCGHRVNPRSMESLKLHEECQSQWNGRNVLKIIVSFEKGWTDL